MNSEAVVACRLTDADIGDGLLLSGEAGWNQTAADWAIFIRRGTCYGLRFGTQLVATAAILPFGNFGWISMVLVTSNWRRRGLATQLVMQCVQSLRALGCASLLDATPDGACVYSRLGFKTRCGMTRWRGRAGAASSPAPHCGNDFTVIGERDFAAFGGDRRFLLEDFLGRPGSFLVRDKESFVVARQGRNAIHIGPIVADSPEVARHLLNAALDQATGPVIIDVLDEGKSLDQVFMARGFAVFRRFERMILDREGLPGMPSCLIAAAGPEFG